MAEEEVLVLLAELVHDIKPCAALITLKRLLIDNPDIVQLRRNDDAEIEVRYHRRQLAKTMVISSWERALKHAGFYVAVKTSSIGNKFKVWHHVKK